MIVQRLFDQARSRNIQTLWNPSPMPEDPESLLGVPTYLSPIAARQKNLEAGRGVNELDGPSVGDRSA